jgi:hypothetical protein
MSNSVIVRAGWIKTLEWDTQNTDLAPYLLFFCTIFLFGESTPERQLGLQSVRFKRIGAIQLTPFGHVFFFSHPCMVMTWGYFIGLTGLPHQVGEKRVPRTPAWVVLMCRALNGTVHKDWRCTRLPDLEMHYGHKSADPGRRKGERARE